MQWQRAAANDGCWLTGFDVKPAIYKILPVGLVMGRVATW